MNISRPCIDHCWYNNEILSTVFMYNVQLFFLNAVYKKKKKKRTYATNISI